jgi:hypothetical protein
MDADYSVELGAAAPALELPWDDPEGRLQYVDLRGGGSVELNCERIPEARLFPALRRFLIELNSERSAWQTAKCDAWTDESEAAENPYDAGFEQSCYVDVVLTERSAALRTSLEFHQRAAREMAQMLEENETLEATAEIMVRSCYFHPVGNMEESDAGYCMTMFLTGYGASEAAAADCWGRAMDHAASCWTRLQPHEGHAQARELG